MNAGAGRMIGARDAAIAGGAGMGPQPSRATHARSPS